MSPVLSGQASSAARSQSKVPVTSVHRADADGIQIFYREAGDAAAPVQCIQEKAPAPAWKTTPSWYLIAEEDRMISAENQRFMAERMGATIRSHNVDHTPMHTAPDLVVDVIQTAVRETHQK